jgi:clavulanate-9-aldehyde reductase
LTTVPEELANQVVAITGASSGIGETLALQCAAAGASVSLAARRSDRIERTATRIRENGGRAVAIPTDVAEESSARGSSSGPATSSAGSTRSSTTPG